MGFFSYNSAQKRSGVDFILFLACFFFSLQRTGKLLRKTIGNFAGKLLRKKIGVCTGNGDAEAEEKREKKKEPLFIVTI